MTESKLPDWPASPMGLDVKVVGTDGAYVYLDNGAKLLDAGGQACVSNIGYGRAEVAEVIAKATAECTHVLPPFATDNRLELVNVLREEWLPPALSRIHLVNSGSEAADSAVKLARQYHFHRGDSSRWKVIGRQFSYHGVTLGGLSVSGHSARRWGMEPLLIDFPQAPACYPYRCQQCNPDSGCQLHCADALEEIILREGPETVAAFMAEPVVGTSGGSLVPHPDYWPRIQEICRKYGLLIILDEVITGFGRTGKRFGLEHWGIEPDILTSAKGMSGGYAAIGLLAATEAVVQPLLDKGDVIMFHTFGGHNAACAAALKVLDILKREQLVERAAALGEYMGERMASLWDHPLVGDIRGLGMFWSVEIVRDRTTAEAFPKSDGFTFRVLAEGMRRGVLYYFGGTGDNADVVCLGPPYTVTEAEIDTMVETLRECIDAVAADIAPGAGDR